MRGRLALACLEGDAPSPSRLPTPWPCGHSCPPRVSMRHDRRNRLRWCQPTFTPWAPHKKPLRSRDRRGFL